MAAITVVVCLFMASQSFAITQTLIRNEQNSLALEVPMWIPQSSLLFGFVMIAMAVSARFFLRLSDAETPLPPPASAAQP
jgi:TRAP-type C4-dicarboxylate transport system permease small subunit